MKHLDLKAANLNVNALRLTKNFRNSRQILEAASRLAETYKIQAEKTGEVIDYIDPELAVRETLPPQAIGTDNEVAKAWEIVSETVEAADGDWSVCIATCNPRYISIEDIIRQKPAVLEAKKSLETALSTQNGLL